MRKTELALFFILSFSYLRRGEQRLYLHRGMEGDGSHESTTPSDVGLQDEMGRLEDVSQTYRVRRSRAV